jgi:3'(2'), 5'-bisphosphate nucleotidase
MPPENALTLANISIHAGREILKVYASDFTVQNKSDNSPVTDADLRADAVILEGLSKAYPGTKIVSEEAATPAAAAFPQSDFYLVDPLDGTKEFLSRNGEFTVNIAKIENGIPVCGAVLAPALNRIWIGDLHKGAFAADVDFSSDSIKNWVQCNVASKLHEDGQIVVASRSHRDEKTEEFLRSIKVASLMSAGSSLKFCLVAEGKAHLYPRFGRTMEWDTAAGHAVLKAAGGFVRTLGREELVYGKPGYENPAFIASHI